MNRSRCDKNLILTMKINLLLIKCILICSLVMLCSEISKSQTTFIVNKSHLDYLYKEIELDGKRMGVIHIYSNAPDYKYVGDDDEGYACVDDAARAAIFYLEYYRAYNDSSSLHKYYSLAEFLLYMQAENGFFYNFIWEDNSINKTFKTSVAEPNWWSWRALWALSEGYKILKDVDIEFAEQILPVLVKSVEATKTSFPSERNNNKINGIEFPSWLPSETASDQASVLLLALLNYFVETKDTSVAYCINNLCDGILMMQKGDSLNVPFYAFLSWQNVWHAYGNSQSYALLKASKILERDDLQTAALNEINFFYDYLLDEKFLSSFTIEKDNDSFKFSKKNKYSQIAYNFRPMIFACLEAFESTRDSAYLFKSVEIAEWFFGNNVAGKHMYDPSTGRCFDGINSEIDVNMNSGAESTIEGLLSLLAIEMNNMSKIFLESR
jgi:hypothetical protein